MVYGDTLSCLPSFLASHLHDEYPTYKMKIKYSFDEKSQLHNKQIRLLKTSFVEFKGFLIFCQIILGEQRDNLR